MKTLVLAAQLFLITTAATNSLRAEDWKKHTVYAGKACMTAVAGDFTKDGKPDIICNAGNKTRLIVGPLATDDEQPREIVLGDSQDHNFIHSAVMDVDGDGDLDYIAARYNPGLIVWFEQPDAPLSDRWPQHVISTQVHGIHGLLVGDVDRDGKPDLLATSAQDKPPFPESLAWFRVPTDAKQKLEWPPHILAHQDAPGLTHYLGLGDVNGDGRPDVATGAKGGPTDKSGLGEWFAWWEAPKDPTGIWKKRLLSAQQPGATNIHPADVNGDGQVDFVASRGHGRGVIWFEAPSWKEHSINGTIKEPHCLVVCDMDNDGDIDAAACAFGDEIAAWFENDGEGKFKTHVIGEGQQAYDIRAEDLDGDGDLDILVAGRASNNVVWYEHP